MVPLRQRAPKPEDRAHGVSHLRRVWEGLRAVPWWGWAVVGLVVAPWYLRYTAKVIGTCVEFFAPTR